MSEGPPKLVSLEIQIGSNVLLSNSWVEFVDVRMKSKSWQSNVAWEAYRETNERINMQLKSNAYELTLRRYIGDCAVSLSSRQCHRRHSLGLQIKHY